MQILKYGCLGLGASVFIGSTFANTGLDSSIEWINYKSCIDLTSSLRKYTSSTEYAMQLASSNYPRGNQIFLPSNEKTSEVYIPYLAQNQQLLYIFKGPQEAQTATVNIANPALLAKFHLPKSRKHIQTFFYQDKKLIITAEENQNSLLLIYTIEGKSFKPLKYYKMSGPLKKSQLLGDKFYFISQRPLDDQDLKTLINTNGEAKNLLPTLEQAIKYGLKTTKITEANCQKIAHNITDPETPSLTSLAIFNLNSLDTQPEIKYLLGQLSDIAIGPEYLYILKSSKNTGITCKNCSQKAEGNGEKTLIQGFSLDPKLYQSNNAILSGTLLSAENYLNQDASLELPLYQTSGKIKQYRITHANGKLSTFTETILTETPDLYPNAKKESGTWLLSNDEKSLIITTNKQQTELSPTKLQAGTLFPLENTLIKLTQNNSTINITSTEMGNTGEKNLISINNAQLLNTPYRNSDQKLLSVLTRENGKTTLRGYDFGDQSAIKLLFKRSYPLLSNLSQLDFYINMEKYTVLIAQNIADFFVTKNHQLTKTLKIK